MTDNDGPAFGTCFDELCAACNVRPDDNRRNAYWKALRGCGLADVKTAGEWFMQHGSGDERFPMPSAPMWLNRAQDCARSRLKALDEQTKQCRLCDGTGLQPLVQDGVTRYDRCQCRGGPWPKRVPRTQASQQGWVSTAEAVSDWQTRRDA